MMSILPDETRHQTPASAYHELVNSRSQTTMITGAANSICLKSDITIDLVLLEWSKTKSQGKFEFKMLKNLRVQIFGAIGPLEQPVAFDSILQFLLDDTCR